METDLGNTTMHWISGVLSRDDIETIKETIENGQFIDGKATAGYRARQVKNNLQLQKIHNLLFLLPNKSRHLQCL